MKWKISNFKEKIVKALNSYIQLSFFAMFHDQNVVFHGDPHSGNICIDEEGNICFLDMGLLFDLKEKDRELCRTFYLTAYAGNYEKLYQMLVPYGDMTEEKKRLFKEDCKKYCEELKGKEVTNYFVDMINVCLNYEFVPPDFLFCMSKAFVCLNGINNFSENNYSAIDLLQEQTIEFLLQRSLNDCKTIMKDSLNIIPNAIKNTMNHGIVNTFSKLITQKEIREDASRSLENIKESLNLLYATEVAVFQNKKYK